MYVLTVNFSLIATAPWIGTPSQVNMELSRCDGEISTQTDIFEEVTELHRELATESGLRRR
jgi:hypothetical protein